MSKFITLLTVLLFFFGTMSVYADWTGVEGDIGHDWFESDDPDLDTDIYHYVGGGGGSYNEQVVEGALQGGLTSGSSRIDMRNAPTGFHSIQSSLKTLRLYKADDQGYVLQCSESESRGLSYSIVSVLGVNCISNRNLQGSYTILETQGIPSGAYLVVVRKENQVQEVFKIIL